MKTPRLLLITALALGALPAHGQLTWGVNGAGGTGTWNTSTPNWWNGSTNVAWVAGGQAIFAGTAGTVAVSSPSASKLTFNVSGYVLNPDFLDAAPGGLTVETNADATISSYVFADGFSPGTFTKTGSATLTVTDSVVFFDRVAINAGEMKFTNFSSGYSGAVYSLANAPGVFMTLGTTSGVSVGGLSGGGSDGGIVRPDNSAGIRTLYTYSRGGTFAGSLQDNGAGILALGVSGFGLQELTAANTYSGATTVFGGTLAFSHGGSALNSPVMLTGGTLLLDNTDTLLTDRLSDTAPITVAGTLALRGNGAAPVTETLGPLHFGATRGAVSITPNPTQPSAFVFDSLAPRAAGQNGVMDFQGTGLGSAPGPGVSTVRFTNAPAIVGGSGSDGTPNLSILPAAFGSVTSGTTFVTYGANGIRPLTDAEYTSDLLSAGALGNVGIGTAINVSANAAVNSLRLKAGGSVGGSGTLAIRSGMILAQPGSGSLSVGALDFGGAEAIIIAESDLTIGSAILGNNPTNGLTKVGAGRLTLAGNNSYTGAINVVGGVLSLINGTGLGDATSAVTVQSGAAIELQGGITVATKPLTVIGSGPGGAGSLRSRSGSNAWNGAVSLQSATIGVDAGSLTFGGGITVSGRWIKTGSGSLVFGNAVDSRFADLLVFAGPIISRASAGIPFSDQSLALYGTPVTFAPAGAGADVALTEGGNVFGSRASVVSFNQGSSTLILDKGANNTLTVALGRFGLVTPFSRGGNATLVIAASRGMSGLGISEKLIGPISGFQPIPLTNGIATPAILGQDNDANRSGDFLTYNTAAGLLKATYSVGTSLQSAAPTAVFNAATPQTLTANAAVYALKVSGQTINLNGKTLTLGRSGGGSGTSGIVPAGLILNGGTIAGGSITLAGSFGNNDLAIYTSLAGGTITSNLTISDHPFGTGITAFGPGLLTLGGNVTGGLTINSGSVRISGTVTGSISLFGDGTLSGTGKSASGIGGGHVSPGNSAGILTASTTQSSVTSTPPSFTAYAFEFTSLGAPTFNLPGASGNDLLRLTHPTTPFVSALTSDNEIALYFNLAAGVHLGDSFLGGFFTDSNAPFDGSILGATWRVFLADPFGDTTFNGIKYSASPNGVLVSTVPQTANFGAGNVNGYITKVTVVPEPGAGALLAGAAGLLGIARLGQRQPAAAVPS